MKPKSLFLPFMLTIGAVGIVLAGAMAYITSVPLLRILSEDERLPLEVVSAEIFGFASESFQGLLDNRKEDDPEEVETAKQDVLAHIGRFRFPVRGEGYHFAVLDADGRSIIDPEKVLDKVDLHKVSRDTLDGEITLTDPRGNRLIGYHRYFPAWQWHLLTVFHEEDIEKETTRIKMLVYGSILFGFILLMAVFYWLLRNRIEKPLQRLIDNAKGMEEGRYDTVPEIGKGEVRDLSLAFNRMGEAIRQRERKLAELAKFPESNPHLLMKVAPDGRILYTNPSVARKLKKMGLPEEAPGLLLPPTANEVMREVSGVEGQKKTIHWETRGRIIEYTLFGFRGEDTVVFHGADVTEEREMEVRLFQAQKMEVLGRIAGGVAHDFNNLLAGIMGYASLLKSLPSADEKVAKAADSIERAAERGAQLTRQLLGFARKGTLEHLPLDLNKIVEETTDIVSQTFSKSIDIRRETSPDLPSVDGDGTQMHQSLMNLCINARDAMPDGGTLTVSTRTIRLVTDRNEQHFTIPAGDYAVIVVEDTGHGMDEATQKQIFDPFFTTKSKGKGTGLGMAMVYGIVKNHGGFILVRSAPGKGTRIELMFPPGRHPAPVSADPDTVETPPAMTNRAGTALLVDDEELVRDVGKAMLVSLGYEVLTAANGKEGLDIFRRERDRISFTILDLMMPVMDGRKAFEEIRGIDPGARVIISSGFSGEEDVDRLKAIGANAILPKPYNFNAMTRIITLLENQ